MRNIVLGVAYFMVSSAWTWGAQPVELVRDMVSLDQAYIPVLGLTSEEQLVPSRKTFATLISEWNRFRQAHGKAYPSNPRWTEDLKEVEFALRKAGRIIQEGDHLKEAHEALEHVRQIMKQARERMGIDYFIDHLTRFHDPMEAIVLKCKETGPKDLSLSDIKALEDQLRLGQQLWAKVKDSEFNAALFEFDNHREAALRQSMLLEEQALSHLEKALATGDAKLIVEAGLGLKPPFARCFKLFGRFPSDEK